jgi:transcriptional regulator with XRE-family HTH domain
METFGELLASARRKRRLLQKQVADRAGLDPSYLGALERGRREAPSSKIFQQLLRVLEPSQFERQQLIHALALLRLQRVIEDEAAPLLGGGALLRIARRLPYLAEPDLDLLETLVQRLARGQSPREGAM